MGALQVALAYATLVAAALMLGLTLQARVSERRRELGLKRALGARPVRVASEILAQTLGWCALAGAAGLAAGTALASRICGLEGWVPPEPGRFAATTCGVGRPSRRGGCSVATLGSPWGGPAGIAQGG
jgi:ABC-type lipoprotein release transport system permease subunit